jgi:phosphoribosylformylglycinamidine synthase
VVLPGGFSYGDYLRAGAIARFSPVMEAVRAHAERGGYVLGICNGFQILLEAGLLPGAMTRNLGLRFVCRDVWLSVERRDTALTCRVPPERRALRIPIAHMDGNYTAPAALLERLEGGGQVIFRYSDEDGVATDATNPNGAAHHIAGLTNEAGNVFGMMPHPERVSEALLSGTDGLFVWESLAHAVMEARR